MQTLSLCMVVKDEATTLEKAVKSFGDLPSEVVIGVDKASSDNTLEIAKKIGTDVFEFEWADDFSAARNRAITRCTKDWIYILDGHEELKADAIPKIKDVLENCRPQFKVIAGHLYINTDKYGIPALFFLQPRLFRNDCGIHYENAVHNSLKGHDPSETVGVPEIILIHNMPKEREEKRKGQRKKMNIDTLTAKVEKDPEDSRSWFYLGNTYVDLGFSKEAAEAYRHYLPLSDFAEEKYQALLQLSIIARNDKLWGLSKRYALDAIKILWIRAEAFIVLAEVAYGEEDWKQAIFWYDTATRIEAPLSAMFLQGKVYTWLPWRRLADCWGRLADYAKAMHCIEKCEEFRPGDPEIEKVKNEIKRLQILKVAPQLGLEVKRSGETKIQGSNESACGGLGTGESGG